MSLRASLDVCCLRLTRCWSWRLLSECLLLLIYFRLYVIYWSSFLLLNWKDRSCYCLRCFVVLVYFLEPLVKCLKKGSSASRDVRLGSFGSNGWLTWGSCWPFRFRTCHLRLAFFGTFWYSFATVLLPRIEVVRLLHISYAEFSLPFWLVWRLLLSLSLFLVVAWSYCFSARWCFFAPLSLFVFCWWLGFMA